MQPMTPHSLHVLPTIEEIKKRIEHDIKTGQIYASNSPLIAPSIRDELIYKTATQRKISIQEIKQRIDKETLFLFAFVPFVVAEIAWDFADTCIDLSIIMKLRETKRLCRRIRELRRDYDRKRQQSIDAAHRQIETDNMIAFQEDYKEFFKKLSLQIRQAVNNDNPGLGTESHMLICSAYSCAVVLRSLFKYTDIMGKRIAALLGIKAIGSIIVREVRELEAIILQFAGEDSINNDNKFPPCLNTFVDTLVNYLMESEMIELPCPID